MSASIAESASFQTIPSYKVTVNTNCCLSLALIWVESLHYCVRQRLQQLSLRLAAMFPLTTAS